MRSAKVLWYLERPGGAGGGRYYLVKRQGDSVLLHWGRIGCAGRPWQVHLDDVAAAKRYAARKAARKRLGYRFATPGIRQKIESARRAAEDSERQGRLF